jgi:hypothetical protein
LVAGKFKIGQKVAEKRQENIIAIIYWVNHIDVCVFKDLCM